MDDETMEKLHQTAVMQNVLRHMCSHPEHHGMYDGWGRLEPWDILKDPNQLRKLIQKCTSDIGDIRWTGRNL